MDIFLYAMIIFILICIILIWFISTYNRFQSMLIRINEAESNIDTILRKRFDLLNKSIGIIKASTVEMHEAKVLEGIVKLRSAKLSNFDLDRKLYDSINEFHLFKENIVELRNSETFMKIDASFTESEIEITALRKYYNDIITDYNKYTKIFPSIIIAKINKYKIKPYYDGKDMYDENIEDFKL